MLFQHHVYSLATKTQVLSVFGIGICLNLHLSFSQSYLKPTSNYILSPYIGNLALPDFVKWHDKDTTLSSIGNLLTQVPTPKSHYLCNRHPQDLSMSTIDSIHEVFEGDVQYPYADVGAPELLHISKVNQDNRKGFKYTCPYCKNTLRPRLSRGSRRSHFAHNPGECCDQDRYIHSTAERLLKEKWDRNEPFEITFGVRTVCSRFTTCFYSQAYKHQCFFHKPETFDLKKYYSTCLVEKKYGEFIPDLCLIDETGKHEPIFIEIWSKHKNSEKKAESDYKIIEIRLRTVADLENLPKHPITESENVTFNHFKTLKKEPEAEDGPELMKYTLFADSLKSYVDTKYVSCTNYNTKHHAKAILEIVGVKNDFYTVNHFRKYCNAIAIEKGCDIRSCYLCRQYGEDKSSLVWDAELCTFEDPVLGCRRNIKNLGIIPCKPDDARTCDQFVLKDYPLKKIMETYADTSLYIWERHPDGTESEEYRERKNNSEDTVNEFASFTMKYPNSYLV